MKFITVRDFRTYPKKIWDDLKKSQEMVITNNGKPIALLTPLMDSNLESTIKAVRRAKAMISLEEMWNVSIKNKNYKLSEKEINNIISDIRKKGYENSN